MIPVFNKNGLLPPGNHTVTLSQIEQRYTYNYHRKKLFNGLKRGIKSLRKVGCTNVYLDGSYITDKDLPGDFDACWDIQGVDIGLLLKIEPVLLQFDNLRAAQKAKFHGEFFPAQFQAENTSPFRTFLDFFQVDKDTGDQKGILRINLVGKNYD